jgi:hypothetical protein
MSYRKIWEKHNGKIPYGYEIHHIDGNRKNNHISNLLCVSIEDHYKIHYEQGDYLACSIMADRMKLSVEERKKIHKMAMLTRDQTGSKNPMYGRSAILENNLKWYNDGITETMFEENKQPEGFNRGRLFVPSYDKTGKNNPRAKQAIVNGKLYDCLKDAHKEYPHIPYSTLKSMARTGKIPKKYNLEVRYV